MFHNYNHMRFLTSSRIQIETINNNNNNNTIKHTEIYKHYNGFML